MLAYTAPSTLLLISVGARHETHVALCAMSVAHVAASAKVSVHTQAAIATLTRILRHELWNLALDLRTFGGVTGWARPGQIVHYLRVRPTGHHQDEAQQGER